MSAAPARTAVVGASVPRKEDDRLVTGAGTFVADLRRDGMLHARVVRSPVAHARIGSVETGSARSAPGVAAVLTAADLPAGMPPIPVRLHERPGMERFLQRPLARDVVRYVGEPVALVVADTPYRAEDAAELVDVDYDPLPAASDLDAAAAPGAPVLHEAAGTNVVDTLVTEWGDVDAAFAAAETVVERRLESHRHAAVPLETRGLLAEVERGTGILTVYGAAKVPHVNRRLLARLLDWPEERIRLVEVDVGGAFGARGEFYPEDLLIPFAATRLGRAVAWTEDRAEHLLACNHSRRQVHDIALALDADGRFLALRDRVLSDAGAYVRTQGFLLPGMTSSALAGPYRWPAYRVEATHVVTATTPTGAFRAPGRYEANFARERIIDVAARELGLDPLELRRRNLIPAAAMPYDTGTHTAGHPVVYDSGDYDALLRRAIDELGWEELQRWRNGEDGGGSVGGSRPSRPPRGIGAAVIVEKSGVASWETARVELAEDGAVTVHTGASALGQGLETVLAQICADALGVPYEDVRVLHGDTAAVADGVGTYGSRATSIAGSAVHVAAERLCARLEAGERPPLAEEHTFRAAKPSYPYAVHLAAVEVDVETCAVRVERYAVAVDVGRAVNPALVEAQVAGGAAQGISGTLLEELVFDGEGQPLTASFADHLLATAAEVPAIDVLVAEDAPTDRNPLGVKGAGEGGTAGAGAAIANAVSDALGAEVTRLPITPDRVRELVAAAAPGPGRRPA